MFKDQGERKPAAALYQIHLLTFQTVFSVKETIKMKLDIFNAIGIYCWKKKVILNTAAK